MHRDIKCSNCGSTDFVPTKLGEILGTEGYFSVNAYACLKCGHIELFEPSLDLFAKQKKEEAQVQKVKEKAAQEIEKQIRDKRICKLTETINDENATVKQVKEAKKELESIKHNWW